VFAEWHLFGAASSGAVNKGQLLAACGENLGDAERMIERVEDGSVIGNRSHACQVIALSRTWRPSVGLVVAPGSVRRRRSLR
jgi:hypothetical protein